MSKVSLEGREVEKSLKDEKKGHDCLLYSTPGKVMDGTGHGVLWRLILITVWAKWERSICQEGTAA